MGQQIIRGVPLNALQPEPIQGVPLTALQPAESAPISDPNTFGTFGRHTLTQANPVPVGQALPFPKVLGGGGWDAPIQAVSGMLQAQSNVKAQGDAAWAKGDHVEAVGHYLNWLVPLLGPIMDQAGNETRSGHYAAAAGDLVGLGLSMAAPEVIKGGINTVATPTLAARAEKAASESTAGILAPSGSSKEIRILGKQAKDIAPDVLRGTTAVTPRGLTEQIGTHLDDAGTAFDEAFAKISPKGTGPITPGKQIYSTKPLLNLIDQRINELQVSGTGGQTSSATVADHLRTLQQARSEVEALGTYTDTANLVRLRNQWKIGAKQAFIPEVNPNATTLKSQGAGWADAWDASQQTIVAKHPELAPLNADYHIWKQANDIVTALQDRERVRPTVGRSIMASAAGAMAGSAAGGELGAAVGSVVAPLIERGITQSVAPTLKLTLARQLQTLADAIRSGNVQKASQLAQTIRPLIVTATAVRPATSTGLALQPATP